MLQVLQRLHVLGVTPTNAIVEFNFGHWCHLPDNTFGRDVEVSAWPASTWGGDQSGARQLWRLRACTCRPHTAHRCPCTASPWSGAGRLLRRQPRAPAAHDLARLLRPALQPAKRGERGGPVGPGAADALGLLADPGEAGGLARAAGGRGLGGRGLRPTRRRARASPSTRQCAAVPRAGRGAAAGWHDRRRQRPRGGGRLEKRAGRPSHGSRGRAGAPHLERHNHDGGRARRR